jgi:hypothetical protein
MKETTFDFLVSDSATKLMPFWAGALHKHVVGTHQWFAKSLNSSSLLPEFPIRHTRHRVLWPF